MSSWLAGMLAVIGKFLLRLGFSRRLRCCLEIDYQAYVELTSEAWPWPRGLVIYPSAS